MRRVSRWTRSSAQQASSHHVFHAVRTSESTGMNSSSVRPPLAFARSNLPSPCSSSAATSSGCMNLLKGRIGGSSESIWGSSSGKELSARLNVAFISPAGTAAVSSGGCGQRFWYDPILQVLHDAEHRTCIHAGLFVHSPLSAQTLHCSPSRSAQAFTHPQL
eukprot:CAMPEP_0115829320 /NCGR_PEP_ID=MMETSP0287-20121206/1037_1 /TAXON_ID=412157 /ORGANISM="Chrysochromulina rotalis, Strain UIO044" /LENGTH=161 /DNA_ID=CAMNT_0003282581 /DNA_START=639 /DNA_END=1124 /DNA_ORIENTATION=+